jgi:CubicO group peptidase (beta-lactamase class C family)
MSTLCAQRRSGSRACLVGVGDEIALNAGYGQADRDRRIENTPETVFSLGSVAKQFTAATIMKLEEAGKLSTTDAVGRFVAGVPATHVASVDSAIAFYWRDGKLLGLGEGDPAAGYQVRLARADGGYLAYDLRLARTVGVEFEGDRLALTSNGRTVRAERR